MWLPDSGGEWPPPVTTGELPAFDFAGFEIGRDQITKRHDLAAIGHEVIQELFEQGGFRTTFGFGVDGQHVEVIFLHA